MSALQQWWREIDAGLRTAAKPWDALWSAACREVAEREALEFRRESAARIEALKQRPSMDVAPLDESLPAVERWRQWVLEHQKRYAPLDVAAAWELTASECDRRGFTDRAEEARASARAQLKRKTA